MQPNAVVVIHQRIDHSLGVYLIDAFRNKYETSLGPGLYLIRGDNAGSPFFIHVRRTDTGWRERPAEICVGLTHLLQFWDRLKC